MIDFILKAVLALDAYNRGYGEGVKFHEGAHMNTLLIDCRKPEKLYRYSEERWLERSLKLGEFRLRPAADYKSVETDSARNDDELVRRRVSEAKNVTIINTETGKKIKPVGPVTYETHVNTNYLLICFAKIWSDRLFQEFPGTDACLVINDVQALSERIHDEVEKTLPDWIGIDGDVSYMGSSQLGAVFAKPPRYAYQEEWRFAWRPKKPTMEELSPKLISIGSIEDIAELRKAP